MQTQALVLSLIVDQDQRPWSAEEVTTALGGKGTRLAVCDALSELRNYGLIHHTGELYFASQAAVHVDRLGMMEL